MVKYFHVLMKKIKILIIIYTILKIFYFMEQIYNILNLNIYFKILSIIYL